MIDVMYADEARMHSRRNWLIFSDAGRLTIGAGAFLFEGRRHRIDAARIDDVGIESARVAWGSGIAIIALAAVFVAVLAAVGLSSGVPQYLVWGVVGLAAFAGLFTGFYGYGQQVWVRVEGAAADGEPFVAYLRQDERKTGGGFPRRKKTQELALQLQGVPT